MAVSDHPSGLCPFIPVTRFPSGESAWWPLEVWSRMQSVGVLYWLQLGVGAPPGSPNSTVL